MTNKISERKVILNVIKGYIINSSLQFVPKFKFCISIGVVLVWILHKCVSKTIPWEGQCEVL